jgi:hypothetical protein
MSSILYYSTHCRHSSDLLTTLGKTQLQNEIHFVCLDNRICENGKTYNILPNGQKLIMPISITSVPALFLIASCKTLYGADIVNYLKPEHQREIEQATQGNMIPSNFAFASGGNNVISDTYSFLDQSASELAVEGTGGQRQMYNYNQIGAKPSNKQSTFEQYTQMLNSQPSSTKLKGEEGINTDDLEQARTNDDKKMFPKSRHQFNTM